MVESSPPGPTDAPDDAARFEGSDPAPEQAGQEVTAAKPYGAAILGGIVVFHEPIGSGPLGIGARFLAFLFVIAGAALMPTPMRAAPDAASTTG